MATSKLHQLLAVHKSFEGQAGKCRAELQSTFEKKSHHFREVRKTFKSNKEDEPPRVEEELSLQTTVFTEMKWIQEKLAKALDVGHQIDVANTLAKADVVVDGAALLKQVPATSLLQIEKRLHEVQQLVLVIPTLDPAKGFKPDPDHGAHVFRARDVEKFRTQKIKEPLVVYPATKEHAAQVTVVDKDVPIGVIMEQEWSGLITVTQKADVLDRLEKLVRAVQSARAKANEQELDQNDHKIGQALLEYAFQPLA